MVPIVCKPSVALNNRVGLNKLLTNVILKSVDMSHVDHCQSLIEQHRSFHRVTEVRGCLNGASQRRPIFHIRIHETS